MLDASDHRLEIDARARLDGLRERRASVPQSVRSRGELRLRFTPTARGTAVAEQYQAGCLKVRIPRVGPGEDPCAVLLNTSGGLADGDRLAQHIAWDAGTAATVTTQAAEKAYRALFAGARIETRLDVAAGANAEWLPQETIMFDSARLVRDTRVSIGEGANFLGLEAVVLGRSAMGEVVAEGALADGWRIRRGGRLIYADALRLEGPVDDLMRRAAIGAGARAMAVLVHVSAQAASLLGRVREALAGALGTAAASAWNGMLVTRLLARDGAILRHDMLRALSALRGARPLPRVWAC